MVESKCQAARILGYWLADWHQCYRPVHVEIWDNMCAAVKYVEPVLRNGLYALVIYTAVQHLFCSITTQNHTYLEISSLASLNKTSMLLAEMLCPLMLICAGLLNWCKRPCLIVFSSGGWGYKGNDWIISSAWGMSNTCECWLFSKNCSNLLAIWLWNTSSGRDSILPLATLGWFAEMNGPINKITLGLSCSHFFSRSSSGWYDKSSSKV